MAKLPYESATSGRNALDEMRRILLKLGCTQFGTMDDTERGTCVVRFTLNGTPVQVQASARGYARAWLEANPWTTRRKRTRADHEQQAVEIASYAVYSILRDWVKAQAAILATGVLSADELFLAHQCTDDGRRVIDVVQSVGLLELEDQSGRQG